MRKIFGLMAACVALLATSAYAQSEPPVASTVTSGTVTTMNVFQSVIAQSSTRKGCMVQNTSAAVMYVYPGSTANATLTNSFQLPAGAFFDCSHPGGATIADQINISSGTAGATYVASRQ